MMFRKPGHSEPHCATTPIAGASPCALRWAIALGATVLLGIGQSLVCPQAALGQLQPPGQPAMSGGTHPAVVRVIATDRNGFSLGSGTLVAVTESHGLVMTNWHVVRDAAGPIAVAFPNGFRSSAMVLRTDRDWDLAALAIWRPNVEPVALASVAPQPGEPLSIAGYGPGQYRTITGRCTQYVSPGFNQPFEMIELSAPARQGDSGGPIFNSRGELAGVLFGTAGGQTAGSYCGRVRVFLGSVRDDFFRLQPNPSLLAQNAAAPSGPVASASFDAAAKPPAAPPAPAKSAPRATVASRTIPRSEPASPPAAISGGSGWVADAKAPAGTKDASAPSPAAPESTSPGTITWEDIKNYLAGIGVVAILFHGLKFVAAGSASERGRRRGR
jgi:hypothetical protein